MATTRIQTIPARRGVAARVAKGQRIKVINTHGSQRVPRRSWHPAPSSSRP